MLVQSYPSCRQEHHYPHLRSSDDLTVETQLIVPGETVHGVGDLMMIPCEFQNIRLEDAFGSRECSSYTNLNALSGNRIDPVSMRSTCPFYYQRNIGIVNILQLLLFIFFYLNLLIQLYILHT